MRAQNLGRQLQIFEHRRHGIEGTQRCCAWSFMCEAIPKPRHAKASLGHRRETSSRSQPVQNPVWCIGLNEYEPAAANPLRSTRAPNLLGQALQRVREDVLKQQPSHPSEVRLTDATCQSANSAVVVEANPVTQPAPAGA